MSTKTSKTTGMITAAQADDARTAKALLKWYIKLHRKDGLSLAKEHREGILSDHEVIRYIENEAPDLLTGGFYLSCSPIYLDILPLDADGEPELTKPPVGFAYLVDRDEEDEDEEDPDQEDAMDDVSEADSQWAA